MNGSMFSSLHSTDLQVAVTHHDMQPCADKDSGEEDCKPVNMDVNNN